MVLMFVLIEFDQTKARQLVRVLREDTKVKQANVITGPWDIIVVRENESFEEARAWCNMLVREDGFEKMLASFAMDE